VRHNFTNS